MPRALKLQNLVEAARRLRQQEPDAAKLLWSLLRNRQLAGAKFRREHQLGPYIADFYAPEHRLVIEADGGGHFTPEQQAEDTNRDQYLRGMGLTVLRFTNDAVLLETESVLQAIFDHLTREE